MKFTFFRFENFKGIEDQTLDLRKIPGTTKTLVGLNESGKTTILEAINYFAYKPENLSALDLDNYEVGDIHNLIPINKRDNFNGKISIQVGVLLDDEDISLIKNEFLKNGISQVEIDPEIIYTQNYHFKNSTHVPGKNQSLWSIGITGRRGKGRKPVKLKNEEALIINPLIKQRMPSILYFPNFLFEFPERIYLGPDTEDKKHRFYQDIIQDVLDSLDNGTNIEEHIIKRIKSTDEKDKRALTSLLGKMQKQLTEVIFKKWNQIFNKEISRTEIILYTDEDNHGAYIEFNIKDDVDTYRIGERSLGFRWFFVYILLTQFRSFRKRNNSALFLFDEPASNLHPSAQMELLKSFEKLPGVIYTTHSHYLINPKWLESTFVIKNSAIDYDNEAGFSSKNTNISIHKYRDFATCYPNQSNYFQPILEVLDYKPTNLELVPQVVITEGKSDYYLLHYFQNVILKKQYKINIVPGVSSGSLEVLISLYLGWGVQFLVLLDSDNEGKKQRIRYLDLFGSAVEDFIVTYEHINSTWDNTEIEDVLSADDRMTIQNHSYPSDTKFNKKNFYRSVQELSLKEIEVELSEDTRKKFDDILTFIMEKIKPGT